MEESECLRSLQIVSLRAEDISGYYPEFCPWNNSYLMGIDTFMDTYLKQVEGASYFPTDAQRSLCCICERTWYECTGHPHFMRMYRIVPMVDKIVHLYRMMRDRVFYVNGTVYPRTCSLEDVGKIYNGKEPRPSFELKEHQLRIKHANTRRTDEGERVSLYDFAFNAYMHYRHTGSDEYLHYFTHIVMILPGVVGHASERNTTLLKTFYYSWYKLRTHIVNITYHDIMEQTSGENELHVMRHAVRLLQEESSRDTVSTQNRLAVFLLQSENSTANIIKSLMPYVTSKCIAFGHSQDDDIITKFRNYLYYKAEKDGDQKYPRQGLMELLGSKTGLIRQTIMGKRLARFIRTPISPAANVRADYVTCPRLGMKTLTKEYVASSGDPVSIDYARILLEQQEFRYIQMTESIRNIDYERRCYSLCGVCCDCIQRSLDMLNEVDGVIVFRRNIREMDVGIMNRQPTLSKRSVHGVRVLSGSEQTLGLPVGTATSFNADFDGDEMHFWYPEGYIAESEIRLCMSVRNNIDAFCELGQDSIHGLYLLTRPSTRLSKRMFFNGVASVAALIDVECPRSDSLEYKGIDLFNVLGSVEWMKPVFCHIFGMKTLDSKVCLASDTTYVIRDVASGLLLGLNNDGFWGFHQTGMEFTLQFTDNTSFRLWSKQLGYAVDYHGQESDGIWIIPASHDTILIGDECTIQFEGNQLNVVFETTSSVLNKSIIKKLQHAIVALVTSDANAIAAFDALTALGVFAIDSLGSTLCYQDFRVQVPAQRAVVNDLVDVVNHRVNSIMRRSSDYHDFTDKMFAFTQSRISNMNPHSSWSGIKAFTHGSCSKGDPQKLREMTTMVGVRDLARTFVYGDLQRTTHFWPRRSKENWNITERGLVNTTYIEGLSPEQMCIEYMTSRLNLAKSKLDVPTTGYMNRKLHATFIDILKVHDGTVRDNNRILVYTPMLYVPEYEKAWKELVKQYGADFETKACSFLHGRSLELEVEVRKQVVRCAMQPGYPIGIVAASDVTQAFTQSALNSFHSTMSSTDGTGEIAFILEQAKDTHVMDGNAMCYFRLRSNTSIPHVLYHCSPLTLKSVITSMEVIYDPARFRDCLQIEELMENAAPPLWKTVLKCHMSCMPYEIEAVANAISSFTKSYVLPDTSSEKVIWVALVKPTLKRSRVQTPQQFTLVARNEFAALQSLRNLVLSGGFTRDLENKVSRRKSKRDVKETNSTANTHRFLQVQWKGLHLKGKHKGQNIESEKIGVHCKDGEIRINACSILNVLHNEKLVSLVDVNTIHSDWHASNCACLGIEAALAFMRKSLRRVAPKVHPFFIEVISQHLAWTGKIESTNRHGNIQAKSPFDSIAFEQVMKFIRQMDEKPKNDALLTHSARTMFSLPVPIGSGLSDIMY